MVDFEVEKRDDEARDEVGKELTTRKLQP